MVDKTGIVGGGIGGPGSIGPTPAGKTAAGQGKDFKNILMESINEVNRLQNEAQQATEQLMTGQTSNVAEVLSAVRKADIAFSMLMQIRNQLMDAYTEIRNMRM